MSQRRRSRRGRKSASAKTEHHLRKSQDAHLGRGLRDEGKIMTLVSRANGPKLAALARMRDRTINQLADLGLLVDDFHGPRAFAFLVLAQGIGTLDAIRILLEHGYGRRALAMVRTLYDLEIDAFLLSTGDEELMSRYTRYERWERAVKAARLLYTADHDDERIKDGIVARQWWRTGGWLA